jgi:thiamine biosynthesis lipoprotein
MGTLVRVTVYTQDERTAADAFRAAFDRIHALDEILSDYREDSELNRIARTAVGRPVRVSDDLFAVLSASQELAAATGGAFDVTEGPVIGLWREARKTRRLPGLSALQEAEARSGYRKLHLDQRRRTVTLEIPGMALDVGGIAKGYAASAALEVLSGLGIRSALVAVSGDLAFSDAPPGEAGWRIGIRSGEPATVDLPDTLVLTNAAVSTSGNAAQHVDVDGRRYSHIVDPSTGHALDNDITVTVVARHGAEADGCATAVSVLGAERGLEFVESRQGVAALIIERTSARTKVLMSSRFRALAGRSSFRLQPHPHDDRRNRKR